LERWVGSVMARVIVGGGEMKRAAIKRRGESRGSKVSDQRSFLGPRLNDGCGVRGIRCFCATAIRRRRDSAVPHSKCEDL